MGLVYVTGVSGVGKTEVCKELDRRGYLSYGTDEAGISSWWEDSSGRSVENQTRDVWKTREWQEQHTWRMSRERLEQIAIEVGDGTAFICGTAANEKDVWDLFSQVICLCLDDEAELRRRINQRSDNPFGKEVHEWEAILGWNPSMKQRYTDFGASIVDAAQPLDRVVDEVIAAANEKANNDA